MGHHDSRLSPLALVVDDDEELCDLLAEGMRAMGLEAATAHSRDEALAMLRRVLPHVIFMDLLMPGMDVDAFAAALRTHPAWSRIPLIAATIIDPPPDGFRWADAALTKPFVIDEIVGVLRACGVPVTGHG